MSETVLATPREGNKAEPTGSSDRRVRRRLLPWIGILAVCVAFVIGVVRTHPSNFFGFTEDDSIYFSSAKALASGQGYVLASFPGTPAATKYPMLYPWMLSLIWRWHPSFPANLREAIGVTVLFGLLYLLLSFVFFRRVVRFSYLESLMVTAFCGLHPLFLFYSGQVLSDIPFAALALAAICLAEVPTVQRLGDASAAGAGLFAGVSILMRILGIPMALGIGWALATRRSWRRLVVFCASVAPFFAATGWHLIFPRGAVSPAIGPAASKLPWIQTWAYYTSYAADWRIRVPNAAALLTTLKVNAFWLVRAPADYFLRPWPASHTLGGQVIAMVITAMIIRGIVRLGTDSKGWAYASGVALYSLALLCWVYVNYQRFLIPFLPLFAAGLYAETKQLAKSVKESSSQARGPRWQKLGGYGFGLAIVIFVCVILVNFYGGLRKEVADLSESRGALLREKREAYSWLASSIAPSASVVASDDGVLYLYSGREAVRPAPNSGRELRSTTGKIPPDIATIAEAVGSEYWLISDDDADWRQVLGRGDIGQGNQLPPLVFRSAGGHVRVYSLRCLADASCGSASGKRLPTFLGAAQGGPSALRGAPWN